MSCLGCTISMIKSIIKLVIVRLIMMYCVWHRVIMCCIMSSGTLVVMHYNTMTTFIHFSYFGNVKHIWSQVIEILDTLMYHIPSPYDQSEFIKFIKQSTAACLVPFTSDHLKHQHGQVWSKYEPVAWMIQSAEAATLHHASFLLIYVCNHMVQLPQKLGIFISSDNKSLFSSFRFKHP